ncbi:MAG: hypothetical protein JSS18_07685 [Proteobacteria bacterium]|nr:hypothetical protein [Pseudomonadota bacterium]MBS0415802.1 hypothetical protein [Pseudomonadota bacterium]
MALDERDYMRESARQIVERDYYGLMRRLEQRRTRRAGWLTISVFWALITLGLWLAYRWAGFR